MTDAEREAEHRRLAQCLRAASEVEDMEACARIIRAGRALQLGLRVVNGSRQVSGQGATAPVRLPRGRTTPGIHLTRRHEETRMGTERKLTPYGQKLLDPRWQRRRLEILQRDDFTCQMCCDSQSTLHVHHRVYERGRDPWDYEDHLLVTLCRACHEFEHGEKADADASLVAELRAQGLWSGDIQQFAKAFSLLRPHGFVNEQFSVFVHTVESLFTDLVNDGPLWRQARDAWVDDNAARAAEYFRRLAEEKVE